jgi:hypothetical protein
VSIVIGVILTETAQLPVIYHQVLPSIERLMMTHHDAGTHIDCAPHYIEILALLILADNIGNGTSMTGTEPDSSKQEVYA